MNIHLAYGKNGLNVHLNDAWDVTVAEPKYVPALPDPLAAMRQALHSPIQSQPLRELARPAEKIGIIFNDITRATPTPVILEALFTELSHLPHRPITLFNALGTHRPNRESELRELTGEKAFSGYRIVQNNAFDPTTQVNLGQTRHGHEIWINHELLSCDLLILTGFIEPHFFAGFSGGGKAIMPGMAGLTTILGNHGAEMIAHPNATWGITHGNPLWEEVTEIALRVGEAPRRLFLVNVALNREKQITDIFAGDLQAAHAVGCQSVRKTAMVPLEQPFEIVLTTNSGYPLDLNLYQSVKGMSAAAQVIQPGGAILIAAECWDGIPEHGLYGRLLRESHSPQELLERIRQPGFSEQDQWQVQIQAQIQLKADVYVYSSALSAEQIRSALLQPATGGVEKTLDRLVKRYGKEARICVLPEGPVTVPYVK